MPLLTLLAFAAANAVPGAPPRDVDLKAECVRVAQVYPLLMLSAIAEGPMDCGDGSGEPVDCAADETPEQKRVHALRWEIRKYQEAGYAAADRACAAWRGNQKAPALREAALIAIAEARARDTVTSVPPGPAASGPH